MGWCGRGGRNTLLDMINRCLTPFPLKDNGYLITERLAKHKLALQDLLMGRE